MRWASAPPSNKALPARARHASHLQLGALLCGPAGGLRVHCQLGAEHTRDVFGSGVLATLRDLAAGPGVAASCSSSADLCVSRPREPSAERALLGL